MYPTYKSYEIIWKIFFYRILGNFRNDRSWVNIWKNRYHHCGLISSFTETNTSCSIGRKTWILYKQQFWQQKREIVIPIQNLVEFMKNIGAMSLWNNIIISCIWKCVLFFFYLTKYWVFISVKFNQVTYSYVQFHTYNYSWLVQY